MAKCGLKPSPSNVACFWGYIDMIDPRFFEQKSLYSKFKCDAPGTHQEFRDAFPHLNMFCEKCKKNQTFYPAGHNNDQNNVHRVNHGKRLGPEIDNNQMFGSV